jgi:hypothetical protein
VYSCCALCVLHDQVAEVVVALLLLRAIHGMQQRHHVGCHHRHHHSNPKLRMAPHHRMHELSGSLSCTLLDLFNAMPEERKSNSVKRASDSPFAELETCSLEAQACAATRRCSGLQDLVPFHSIWSLEQSSRSQVIDFRPHTLQHRFVDHICNLPPHHHSHHHKPPCRGKEPGTTRRSVRVAKTIQSEEEMSRWPCFSRSSRSALQALAPCTGQSGHRCQHRVWRATCCMAVAAHMCTALFMTPLLQRRNGATSTKQALPLPSPCARRGTRLRARFNPVGPEALARSDMRFLNHFRVQWRGHNGQRIFPPPVPLCQTKETSVV